MFDRIRAGDLLLHQPFESFEPVVQFLREAVYDPAVLAIKQTIYRTGSESPLMDLLIEAARRAAAAMAAAAWSLQARFDEEANINWAERLEAVGAQVVYGVVGLKTHAKLLLVTRREDDRLRRYAHLSTGNYNPQTARLYTDLGHFTADADLTADADAVFQQLASLGRTRPLRAMLQAPSTPYAGAAGAGGLGRRCWASGGLAGAHRRLHPRPTDVPLDQVRSPRACAGRDRPCAAPACCASRPAPPRASACARSAAKASSNIRASPISGDGDADEALPSSAGDWTWPQGGRRTDRSRLAGARREACQRLIDECLVPYLRDGLDRLDVGPDGSWRQRVDVDPRLQASLRSRR